MVQMSVARRDTENVAEERESLTSRSSHYAGLSCQDLPLRFMLFFTRYLAAATTALAMLICPAALLRAEDEPPPVARLSVVDGEGSVLRGDETTSWTAAAVNTPLLAGDAVFAGP